MSSETNEAPKRWILHEASELAARLSAVVLAFDFEIALRGEVLYTGRAKQLDFALLPLTANADCTAAMNAVQQELRPTSITLIHERHWLLYVSKRPLLIVALKCWM